MINSILTQYNEYNDQNSKNDKKLEAIDQVVHSKIQTEPQSNFHIDKDKKKYEEIEIKSTTFIKQEFNFDETEKRAKAIEQVDSTQVVEENIFENKSELQVEHTVLLVIFIHCFYAFGLLLLFVILSRYFQGNFSHKPMRCEITHVSSISQFE